jgi:hypothetical protein
LEKLERSSPLSIERGDLAVDDQIFRGLVINEQKTSFGPEEWFKLILLKAQPRPAL